MANLVSWFEIPATDLERAAKFYGDIFQFDVNIQSFEGLTMGMFPVGNPGDLSGALVAHEGYVPSQTDGPLLYLNGGEDLGLILNRVEAAGGKVIMPKQQISPEVGYMGIFIDSEGNRLALHSNG
ncbi:MAG: VOC family protein [Bacteroidota bacterium]